MTKLESAIRNPRSTIIRLLFVALIVAVFFLGLSMPLVGPDEPRYAQVAREMFQRGDWITPTLGGFNWFEKPALLYWLQIASYNLFGVSEFAARFGSALFGLGTVASLWILGRNIDRSFATNNEQLSTYRFSDRLGLVGASTVAIIAFAHGASFDIIVTFPITAALVSFYIHDSSSKRDRVSAPLVFFYVFMGLALLAKGLVGVVLPFAIIGIYYLLSRRLPGKTFVASLFWGTLVTVAIASVWYVPMYLRHGYEFIDQFFIQHHFQRYTSNKYLHPQPFYFFFWVLPLMTIPWTLFFLAGIWNLGKRVLFERDAGGSKETDEVPRNPPLSLRLFSFCWLAVPVLFFSFSGSKLPGYILPAVPGAIILTTDYIYGFIRKSEWRKYLVDAIAAGTFLAVVTATLVFAPGFANADSVKRLFAVAEDRGFGDSPVLVLHGISHNAEFYAAGRIVRDPDGKQKKFPGPREVQDEIKLRGGGPVLVLVPQEYLMQLLQTDFLETEVLGGNDAWSLVVVREKHER
jgi:4-amino-4-deoxy-L-arabinose transferase-like glycosyltransferase